MADEANTPDRQESQDTDSEFDSSEDQPGSSEEDIPADAAPDAEDGLEGMSNEEPAESDLGGDDPLTWPPSVDVFKLGTVTLHHPARDIVTFMDWGSARRLLKIYEQRREGGLADVLSLSTSQPQSGWLVADLDEFAAISWMPGLPSKAPRTTIDPVLDQAA